MECATDSDAVLVEECRGGNRGAFDLLVRRHYATAWRVARRYSATRDEADDVTQQAFVVAYDRLAQLAETDRFGAWLASIVRNLARMWLRRRLIQPALLSLDEEESRSVHVERASVATAREAARLASTREAVAAALAALPPEQRHAVQLHYLDGYRYHEVALLLDISVGAVRGRLDRARQTLRRELHEMEPSVIPEWALGARELEALRDAALFAGVDATPERRIINTVCFTGSGEVVSTDTHRIFRAVAAGFGGIPEMLIHADLGRILRSDHPDCAQARLHVSAGEAILRLGGGAELRAPLVEGTFPQFRRVIPGNWLYQVTARAGDWLDALGMLSALRERGCAGCDPSERPRVLILLSPSEQSITLRAGGIPAAQQRIGWEVSASFAAQFATGEEALTIAANPIYVEHAVRALHLPDDADVELAALGDCNPFLLQAAESGHTFVVTMPMARE